MPPQRTRFYSTRQNSGSFQRFLPAGGFALAVDGGDEGDDEDRDDVRDLDHRIDRRPGCVLVRVADRVAGDRRGMRLGALAAVETVLDQLLRVVPGSSAGGHGDG